MPSTPAVLIRGSQAAVLAARSAKPTTMFQSLALRVRPKNRLLQVVARMRLVSGLLRLLQLHGMPGEILSLARAWSCRILLVRTTTAAAGVKAIPQLASVHSIVLVGESVRLMPIRLLQPRSLNSPLAGELDSEGQVLPVCQVGLDVIAVTTTRVRNLLQVSLRLVIGSAEPSPGSNYITIQ